MLASLLWLPIETRADFKVLLLTYKIVNGISPLYLSDLLNLCTPAHALCSQGSQSPQKDTNVMEQSKHPFTIDVFKAKLNAHYLMSLPIPVVIS